MNRVVITGYGVVSPYGEGASIFEEGLFGGKSCIRKVQRFSTEGMPTQIAAEVLDVSNHGFKDIKLNMAVSSVKEALKNAKMKEYSSLPIYIGMGLEIFDAKELVEFSNNPASANVEDPFFLHTPGDIAIRELKNKLGLKSNSLILTSACAASTDAIGYAYRRIKYGQIPAAIAGGTDSMLNLIGFAGFNKLSAMSKKNETPTQASTPFNKGRDGFVMGEGAAFFVIESLESAQSHGVTPLAEIVGFGNSLDAYSPSDPHPDGSGAVAAMQEALADAELSPNKISALSAHATGTPKNDPTESNAIRTVFGDHAREMPIMASKSMIGHLISASGAVEIAACLLAMARQEIHQTLNLKDVETGCELRHVMGQNLKHPIKYMLKNSFAFGGQNSCLVLRNGSDL
jgi:3-oxoacyl-[acyl-carrier-protein] synthase II